MGLWCHSALHWTVALSHTSKGTWGKLPVILRAKDVSCQMGMLRLTIIDIRGLQGENPCVAYLKRMGMLDLATRPIQKVGLM